MSAREVLVTGGSGFYGGVLKRRLLNEGFAVTNIDLVQDPDTHPLLTSVQGDIRDASLLQRVFGEHQFEAIFHCAAGKDRTGVLAALLLDAVGVERDAVVADFALTNERLERIGGRLRRMSTYSNYTGTLTLNDMSADPQTMIDVLAALDRDFGGAAGWLASAGLTADELASLRAALTG